MTKRKRIQKIQGRIKRANHKTERRNHKHSLHLHKCKGCIAISCATCTF